MTLGSRIALMLCVGLAALACRAEASSTEDCAGLTRLPLPQASVTAAEIIAAADAAQPEATPPVETFAYCRVQVTAKPTDDSAIGIEVWLPLGDKWNGKFEQVGNGGYAGAIPISTMERFLSAGYAVAGTDDGHHASSMTDGAWALDHPEKIVDYGWRAIHATTTTGKMLVKALKSAEPTRAYFYGCSDGGREGLMIAQRFPTEFNGIVAGAPAYAMTRLLTAAALLAPSLSRPEGSLSEAKLQLLQSTALGQCGQGAAYLKDPRQCHPDLAALRCTQGDNDHCLTEAQIATAQTIYSPHHDPVTGGTLYPILPGAEAVKNSWDVWLIGSPGHPAAAVEFGRNYFAYMVKQNPALDLAGVSVSDLAQGATLYRSVMDSDSADLSAFRAHGGKLIQYHGWNDPGIAPGYSLEYRDRLIAKMGKIDDFYRLYMVPGMLHCQGGDAPTHVNWAAAMVGWVDYGVAPQAVTASDGQGGSQVIEPFQ